VITVLAGDEDPVRVHDRVEVKWTGVAAHLFDASGQAVARAETVGAGRERA
jgi:hypothetical protein